MGYNGGHKEASILSVLSVYIVDCLVVEVF